MHKANPDRYKKMEYRHSGNSGLMLPVLSLGLWQNFGKLSKYETMKDMVLTAFDNGIIHFDLANNYGPDPGEAERNFGRILKEELAPHRDEMIISTKAGYEMWDGPLGNWGSRKHMLASLDQSLERMGLDYVDIFYHHRMDPNTPLEETMGALAQAVRSGKAIYAGLSNYDGEHLKEACRILDELKVPYVINQNRYSILDRKVEQNGLIDAVNEEDKGLIVFSPLAKGMLTDRYLHGIPEDSRVRIDPRFLKESDLTEEKLEAIRQLNEIAKSKGVPLSVLAIRWLLDKKGVTSVLIGASRPQQILQNLTVLDCPPLTEEEMKQIDIITENVRI